MPEKEEKKTTEVEEVKEELKEEIEEASEVIPEWGQKILKSVSELSEKVTGLSNQETPTKESKVQEVEIPIPTKKTEQENETPIQWEVQEEQKQETKSEPKKSLLQRLADYLM